MLLVKYLKCFIDIYLAKNYVIHLKIKLAVKLELCELFFKILTTMDASFQNNA